MIHWSFPTSFLLALVAVCSCSGVFKKMACEYENLDLVCLEDQEISINYAEFGRKNGVYCNTVNSWLTRVTNCTSLDSTLTVLRTRCNHKRECRIPINSNVLGDPCANVQKYLEVGYECVQAGRLMNKYACEGETLSLSCTNNRRIYINEATFGRTDPIKCYLPGTIVNTNTCRATTSTTVVASKCDGQTSCQIGASTSVFGEPCDRIRKYLDVKYVCQ